MQFAEEIGSGYLKPGQSSLPLSGGEARGMKIINKLAKGYLLKKRIFSFHLCDCCKLLNLFHRLVEQGYAVIVSGRKMDVPADEDYRLEQDPKVGSMLLDWRVPDLERKGNIPTNTRLHTKSSNHTQNKNEYN